jgi:hypothetical protein
MSERVEVATHDSYYSYQTEMQPVLTKEELISRFHPKQIVKCRPRGISTYEDDEYVSFGGWSVKVKDFKEVLANCPHYPNKKESKALRKAKIKQGK